MGEKLIRFLLDELTTIRLLCQNDACRAVTELRIATLRGKLTDQRCPLCHDEFGLAKGNLIDELATVIERFGLVADKMKIEFTLPDKS